MDKVLNNIRRLRDDHKVRCGERKQIAQRISELIVQRDDVAAEQIVAKEAILLLEQASQGAREAITKRFNDIVTFALQCVFGPGYRFETSLKIKRNAVHADFHVFDVDYEVPADPMDSRGGGVLDVVSLALRIVLLELYTPKIDGPLLLDEPLKWESKGYSSRAAELLRVLSERTKRQIIMVTHDEILGKDAEVRIQL